MLKIKTHLVLSYASALWVKRTTECITLNSWFVTTRVRLSTLWLLCTTRTQSWHDCIEKVS